MLKETYKGFLKQIDRELCLDTFSEFTSCCYELNYIELLNKLEKDLLLSFQAFSKGSNGKLYQAIKKFVRELNKKEVIALNNLIYKNLGKVIGTDTFDKSTNPIYQSKEYAKAQYENCKCALEIFFEETMKAIKKADSTFSEKGLEIDYLNRSRIFLEKYLGSGIEINLVDELDENLLEYLIKLFEVLERKLLKESQNDNSNSVKLSALYLNNYFIYIANNDGTSFKGYIMGKNTTKMKSQLYLLATSFKFALMHNKGYKIGAKKIDIESFSKKENSIRMINKVSEIREMRDIDEIKKDLLSSDFNLFKLAVKRLSKKIFGSIHDIEISAIVLAGAMARTDLSIISKSIIAEEGTSAKLLVFYNNIFLSQVLDNNISNYYNYDTKLFNTIFITSSNQEIFDLEYFVEDGYFDVLRHRKFLIPSDGIIAEYKESGSSEMTSVYIREFDNQLSEHCISCIFKGEKRGTRTMIINLTAKSIITNEVTKSDICNLPHVLGCDFVESVLFSVNYTDTQIHGEAYKSNIISEIDITSPYYWKYKDHLNKGAVISVNSPTKVLEKKVIAPFVRNLPKGSKAGCDRKLLAEKYCLDLEDNKTIVDSFVRAVKSSSN